LIKKSVFVLAIIAIINAAQAQQPEPINPRFHHVHLNSTDPDAAIDYYTSKFKAERRRFSDENDAVWTGDSWLLFNKVDTPPPSAMISALFHIGWGAVDMSGAYQEHVNSGTLFQTPLEDISGRVGYPEGSENFFFAYIDGPDHALIEINTANNDEFGHVHLFSEDPIAAGEWYETHLGVRITLQREERVYKGSQIGPSASFRLNHVRVLIWPTAYLESIDYEPWNGRQNLAPTSGRVLDHIGVAVDDLDKAVEAMRRKGLEVILAPDDSGFARHAFLEGPDRITIELVEE